MEPIDLNLHFNSRYVPQMLLILVLLTITDVQCQTFMNRAPQFIPGQDMTRFSLPENTPVNSPVYQLRGKEKLWVSCLKALKSFISFSCVVLTCVCVYGWIVYVERCHIFCCCMKCVVFMDKCVKKLFDHRDVT